MNTKIYTHPERLFVFLFYLKRCVHTHLPKTQTFSAIRSLPTLRLPHRLPGRWIRAVYRRDLLRTAPQAGPRLLRANAWGTRPPGQCCGTAVSPSGGRDLTASARGHGRKRKARRGTEGARQAAATWKPEAGSGPAPTPAARRRGQGAQPSAQ